MKNMTIDLCFSKVYKREERTKENIAHGDLILSENFYDSISRSGLLKCFLHDMVEKLTLFVFFSIECRKNNDVSVY